MRGSFREPVQERGTRIRLGKRSSSCEMIAFTRKPGFVESLVNASDAVGARKDSEPEHSGNLTPIA